jgi:hypothetical protein
MIAAGTFNTPLPGAFEKDGVDAVFGASGDPIRHYSRLQFG